MTVSGISCSAYFFASASTSGPCFLPVASRRANSTKLTIALSSLCMVVIHPVSRRIVSPERSFKIKTWMVRVQWPAVDIARGIISTFIDTLLGRVVMGAAQGLQFAVPK